MPKSSLSLIKVSLSFCLCSDWLVGVKKLGPINGIDLFGRVPHDDWLFKTSNLISKDFLKPSIVEAVKNELPIVLENFRRRQRVDNLFLMGKIGIFAFVLANALGF